MGHDNQKRFNWPLAKVVEVYPSKDGTIRVAKVKTEHGFLVRPVQRLYPLEVSSAEDSDLIRSKCSTETIIPVKDTLKRVVDNSKRTTFPKKDDPDMNIVHEPRISRKGRLIKPPNKLNL